MNGRRKSEGPQLTTVYFHAPSVTDTGAAVQWITDAAALSEMEGRYIALRDLSHSADEGRGGAQLPASVTTEELMARLKQTGADRLFLAGRYRGARIGLGVELNTFELAVTVPEGRTELADAVVEWTHCAD